MANVNIPDLAALTAPAATDEIEVYDASAAANVRLALSYVALTGTANVFTAAQTVAYAATTNNQLVIRNSSYSSTDSAGALGVYFGWSNHGVRAIEFEKYSTNMSRLNLYSEYGFSSAHLSASFDRDLLRFFTSATERVRITSGGHVLIGTTTDSGQLTVNGAMALVDGMTAPGTTSGWAKIYVDSADGDLKVKFGDGTVKTLATDT